MGEKRKRKRDEEVKNKNTSIKAMKELPTKKETL